MKEQVRLAKAMASSYARTSHDRRDAVGSVSEPAVAKKLRNVVRPPNISKSLKKAGAVLLLPPDPITDVAGVVLIGAAFAMSSRQPLSIESLLVETRKSMRDLQSMF